MRKYTDKEISQIAKEILLKGPIEKSLYVYAREILKIRLDHIKSIFPSTTNHAVAIKANSHPEVLGEIVKQGCGLEAASFEEVLLAHHAGCPAEKIVFDSPVKTVNEIKNCTDRFPGMILNANCFAELERLKEVDQLKIGIRINPLVDIGSPGIFNVSGVNSKFGIPVTDRAKIVEYALKMENVRGLHIHAGSEIGSRENHLKAIGLIVNVAEEIRSKGKKLDFIDIGGGIPPSEESLDGFYTGLIQECPEIQDYQIITEYGRFVQSHCAFVLSKVEYILDHCEPKIALIHVGADLFPREIYSSSPPHHDFIILNSAGNQKKGIKERYDIGGPLCFSGDFLTKGTDLPHIEAGDFVCITDTGANSLSMWSRHCSREVVEVRVC
ncbi:type III PLP-dependent enzyme domain-containing protein [Portibacter lacus]|uniref:Diaminopimelate decarboxylase n=1 Tax=Portibacter lacus TaxID=1099794 RepID=A0AA37WHI1_9BACT|nr:hypothetical protein [Portibacter lacus]GLR18840.1 hypothetical protein GCM10007940_34560 [Portibacter lacus]